MSLYLISRFNPMLMNNAPIIIPTIAPLEYVITSNTIVGVTPSNKAATPVFFLPWQNNTIVKASIKNRIKFRKPPN